MLKKIKIVFALLVVVLLVAGFFWLRGVLKDGRLEVGSEQSIDLTPTQIQSIKDIGEWEFLSISAEELVDTVRKGLFVNDELARIYYGTLRLGFNMRQVEPGWIDVQGDSIRLLLPKVGLLDRDFIDEARTKSFYESGTWKPADRELLYKKAYRQMLAHGLTPQNLQAAEENATLQFQQMMRSMGYQKVNIQFKR